MIASTGRGLIAIDGCRTKSNLVLYYYYIRLDSFSSVGRVKDNVVDSGSLGIQDVCTFCSSSAYCIVSLRPYNSIGISFEVSLRRDISKAPRSEPECHKSQSHKTAYWYNSYQLRNTNISHCIATARQSH
jgi:hypothetical protein